MTNLFLIYADCSTAETENTIQIQPEQKLLLPSLQILLKAKKLQFTKNSAAILDIEMDIKKNKK
ncbi:hypothetical protein SOVF_137880 [Spinacia oleracea]|nr:hypothetical protein SOVF_137880 [Spinacia oleracea]